MSDFPRSLIEFQQRFSDEAACARYLFAARWPQGFVCPGCGTSKAWELQTKPWTWECASCGRQTSVTAGTIMHHSKLPLTSWFWAAYLMATHSNGISALQLQRQLGLGSYRSAWLLCAKLRQSMVAPGRTALAGLVEIDETEIPCRSKNDPVTGGGGRSHQGKMLIVGAVEVQDGEAGPGRIRLNKVSDYSADSLHPFIADNLAPSATAKTDGWSAYPGAPSVKHDPTSLVRWLPTSSCPGCTASSLTSRSGRWVSTTACAASICSPISTSSSSASTVAVPGMPRSAPCSASPLATHPSATTC